MADNKFWGKAGAIVNGVFSDNADAQTMAEIKKILGEIKEILKPFDGLGKEKPGKLFVTMKDAIVESNNIQKKYLAKIADAVVKGEAKSSVIKPSAPLKDAKGGDKKTTDGGVGGLLKSIAGPVKDIAVALLIIAVAVALMSVAGVGPAIAVTLLAVFGALLVMLAGMVMLTKYAQKSGVLDKKNPNGIFPLLNALRDVCIAILLLIVVGAIVMMGGWQLIAIGLLTVFVTLAATIFVMWAISKIATKLLGDPENPKPGTPMAFLKGIVFLVLAIVITSIICAIFEPLIMKGLFLATLIFLGVALLANFLISTMSSLKADQLDGIQKILMKIIILIAVVGLLTIILGIIPIGVVVQGLIVMALLVALIMTIFAGLKSMLNAMKDIDVGQMAQFRMIMIAFIVLIAVIGILTIILGLIPTSLVVQGLIVMALLVGLIWVMFMGVKMMLNAMKGVDIAKIEEIKMLMFAFIIMLVVMAVLILVLGSVDTAVIIQGMIALVLIVAFIVLAFFIGSELLSKAKPAMLVKALIGLAVVSVFALAVALVGRLILAVMGDPEGVLMAAKALLWMTLALIVVGLAMILFVAVGAIFCSPFGWIALGLALLGLVVITLFALAIIGVGLILVEAANAGASPDEIIEAGKTIMGVTNAILEAIIPSIIQMVEFAAVAVLAVIAYLVLICIAAFAVELNKFIVNFNKMDWTLDNNIEANIDRCFAVIKRLAAGIIDLADADMPGLLDYLKLKTAFAVISDILVSIAALTHHIEMVKWDVFDGLPKKVDDAVTAISTLSAGMMKIANSKLPGFKDVMKLKFGFGALRDIMDSMSVLADGDANVFDMIYDNVMKFADLTPAIDNMFRFAAALDAVADSMNNLRDSGFGSGPLAFVGALKTVSNLVVEFGTINKLQEAIDSLLSATIAFKEAVEYLIAQGPSGFVSTTSATSINSFDDFDGEADFENGNANTSEAVDGDMIENGGTEIEEQRVTALSIQADIRSAMYTNNYLMRKLCEHAENIVKNTAPEEDKGWFGGLF